MLMHHLPGAVGRLQAAKATGTKAEKEATEETTIKVSSSLAAWAMPAQPGMYPEVSCCNQCTTCIGEWDKDAKGTAATGQHTDREHCVVAPCRS